MNYKQWKEKYVEGKEPVEEVKQEQVKTDTPNGAKVEVKAPKVESEYKETPIPPKEEANKQNIKTLNYEENYKKANEALNNIGDEVPEEYCKKIESNISVSKTDFDKQYKEAEELQRTNKIATLYSLPNNLETKSNQESEQEYFRGIDSSKGINTQKDTTIALNLTLSNKTIITPLQAGLMRVAIENYTKDKEDNFYGLIRLAQKALIE